MARDRITDEIGSLFAQPLEVVSDLAQEKARAEAEFELKRPLFEPFTLEGRTYMVDTSAKRATEVKEPKRDQLTFPPVGSLRGVAELARRHGDSTNTAIVVGADGIKAYLAISADEDDQRPTLLCPYFHGDDAPRGPIGVEELFAWLDRFNGRMGQKKICKEEEDTISLAISTLTASNIDDFEVDRTDGRFSVTAKSKQVVVGKAPLPKYITVRQRLGVREFEVECLYRLGVQMPKRGPESGQLSFTLTRMDTDGAHERFVAWAVSGLQELLNGTVTGVLDETVAEELVGAGEITSTDELVEAPNAGPWIVCEGP